jgi:hypothetical protein
MPDIWKTIFETFRTGYKDVGDRCVLRDSRKISQTHEHIWTEPGAAAP